MQECFDKSVENRQPLHNFGSLLSMGKGSVLQLAIRIVEHQFEKVHNYSAATDSRVAVRFRDWQVKHNPTFLAGWKLQLHDFYKRA